MLDSETVVLDQFIGWDWTFPIKMEILLSAPWFFWENPHVVFINLAFHLRQEKQSSTMHEVTIQWTQIYLIGIVLTKA